MEKMIKKERMQRENRKKTVAEFNENFITIIDKN